MRKILFIVEIVLVVLLVSLQTIAQQPSVYETTKLPFNSDGFSEISPVIVKEGIIFCSDRRFSGFRDRITNDGRRLYNFFLAKSNDSSEWSSPVELKSERSSLFNNGPLCFAPDGITVYFTSEIETGKATKKKDYKNHNGIFIADRSGTNLVSLRPFKYNNTQYEVGQPALSSDGKYLFFASDMPGGQGRSDLYYCTLINEEWSVPVNLGQDVNSSGVENYPYMHTSGRLYFASSRPGGIGKLDLYFTSLNNGRWEVPVLLPEPINSTSDDFAFVAEGNLRKGYFSSNRQRTDDIYEFESTIIRKSSCDTLVKNNYCYRFLEANAVKFDTIPFRFEWAFGDGNKASGPVVEHCFKGPGIYLIQLDLVNLITGEVLHNEKTDTLVVKDIEQPYISVPDMTLTGQKILLNADSTNLPGWEISEYYWNFGDETIAIGTVVDKTYMKPGTYNIQLIVSEEPEPRGTVREACISKNIIVLPRP